MKRIILFVIFCIVGSFTLSAKSVYEDILPANEKHGSKEPILKQAVYVKFKSISDAQEFASGKYYYEIKQIDRLYPAEKSLYYKNRKIDSRLEKSSYDKLISTELNLLKTFMVEVPDGIEPEEYIEKLKYNHPNLEYAEVIPVPDICGMYIPNDPKALEQRLAKRLQVFEAFDVYKGDTNIVIGISDSGVFQQHEDLFDNIKINYGEIPDDLIDNDNNGFVDDYMGVNLTYHLDGTSPGSTHNTVEGHGTGVAGIAAAVTDNEIGIFGLGFKTKFFPIKAMSENSKGMVFGFQSIIYAADNGIDVLNLSWGGRTFSETNQSIIDYAVARNVIIVAAAGNNGNTDAFYPAAYKGVMGVGVTDTNDIVIPMASYGAHCDIMAPGQNASATGHLGNYGEFCCSSGAAPIVAAQLALIKGLHPNLTNLQAIEFARLCSDNIEYGNRESVRKLIPQRVNFLKSVTTDPFSIPAIRPIDYYFEVEHRPEKKRFSIDDTILFKILYQNYLGDARNIEFTLSTAGDSLNSIVILDTFLIHNEAKSGEEFYAGDFRFTIEKFNPETPFFRVDIKADNYKDYFLIPYTPYQNYTVFENDKILLSCSDNGRIAYSDPPFNNRGKGMKLKGTNSLLYEGGFLACEDTSKLVTQVRREKNKAYSDFASIKPYIYPDENLAIFDDSFAPLEERIGLEIESIVEVSPIHLPCVRFYIKLKNKSGRELKDISAGYFYDWDIGISGDENGAFPFEYFIPPSLKNTNTLAALVSREGDYPKVALAVTSNNPAALPQFASFKSSITQDEDLFSKQEQIKYLSSGSEYIHNDIDDIAVITDAESQVLIYPQPAKEQVIIEAENITEIELISLSGKLLKNIKNDNAGKIVISTGGLSAGIYFVKVYYNNQYEFKPLIIN